jgi:hypothetical protein
MDRDIGRFLLYVAIVAAIVVFAVRYMFSTYVFF